MIHDVIRVEFRPDHQWQIEVTAFELDPAQFGLDSWYRSVDSMPQWIQNKLIKLQIMQSPPPITRIEGIGARMADNVFWVYPD